MSDPKAVLAEHGIAVDECEREAYEIAELS